MRQIFAALAIALAAVVPHATAACGVKTDCSIGERSYRIEIPRATPGTAGALIYAHGYRGSADKAMLNEPLRRFAREMGLAFVATKSASDDWLIPGVPEDPSVDGSEELAYFDALLERLETRHNLDRSKMYVTGFSAGGMMVWNLACHRGADFAAFIPIAGTFWEPVPETCPSAPVNLIHIHGTKDKIVPLKGRQIRDSKQGAVQTAIDRTIEAGAFGEPEERAVSPGALTCKLRTNAGGTLLGFCTHNGGHSFKISYLRAAFQLLEEQSAAR